MAVAVVGASAAYPSGVDVQVHRTVPLRGDSCEDGAQSRPWELLVGGNQRADFGPVSGCLGPLCMFYQKFILISCKVIDKRRSKFEQTRSWSAFEMFDEDVVLKMPISRLVVQ